MKLKLFGLSIFEIERGPLDPPAAPPSSTHAALAPPPLTPAPAMPLRSWAELQQSAKALPRTRRGTIDVEASLRLLGLTDPEVLWQRRFKSGTAGAVLKCILGSQGFKSKRPEADPVAHTLDTYPAEKLPLVAGTGKLDLAACLAMFDIQDPSVLWQRRFGPHSAGGRIKMHLRAIGFAPNAAPENSHPAGPPTAEKPGPSPQTQLSDASVHTDESLLALQRDAQGNLDIQASLHALRIADPKLLWRKRVDPGSAEHELKKEIARVLGRRETVAGITRQDIGLTD